MSVVSILDEDLFKCIQKDSASHFLGLLSNKIGKNIDKDNTHYLVNTSLLYIAAEGATKCLTSLLRHNKLKHYVDVNITDDDSDTPLTLSVKQGHVELAGILLEECGVDITKRNDNEETALDLACQKKLVSLLAPLSDECRVNRYIRANQKGNRMMQLYQYTALLQSVESGFIEGTRYLLMKGYSVNLNLNDDKGNILHCVIEHGNMECLDLILSHNVDIEALRRNTEQTPLMLACQYGSQYVVEKLLAKGARIDRQTKECSTALTLACHFGFEDLALYLLDSGADPSITNSWGFTALYMSVDSPDILTKILQHPNIDVNLRCGERLEAPLHLAAVIGCTQAFNLLLNSGAELDTLTEYDEAPLWLAIWKHHTELAMQCIQLNCKLNIPSNGCQVYRHKYTPLELALGSDQMEIACSLYFAGAETVNKVYCGMNEQETGLLLFPPWIQFRKEVLEYVANDEAMYTWLNHVVQNPRTLLNVSVITIRKLIGRSSFQEKVDSLPLPRKLKLMLTMIFK